MARSHANPKNLKVQIIPKSIKKAHDMDAYFHVKNATGATNKYVVGRWVDFASTGKSKPNFAWATPRFGYALSSITIALNPIMS